MKFRSFVITPLVVFIGLVSVQAQSQEISPEPITRPRTVTAPQTPQTQGQTPTQTQVPVPAPKVETPVASPSIEPATPPQSIELAGTDESGTALTYLTPQAIRARIVEAERMFKSRPQPTALTSPSIQFVALAALDRKTARIHQVTMLKEVFLTKGSEVAVISSLGTPLNVRILRANGVNTAATIFDHNGNSLTPLLVEFPIEKRGVFREMAYYTSAHPALLSPDLVRRGQSYVRTTLDLAARRLREKGVFITPQIVDIAERLSLVEHVDHERFRSENRSALYQEIYSLFALNELHTYRYSVSSAGAGGMVQMIPWASNLVKQRHPGVGLTPDFVVGMRTHSNALQAMLLYMQDTWNDLAANSEVQYALSAKLATQTELMAAGYNSNAARLPLYLRRGGQSWRTLIPRETQMYLQIYRNFEALVALKSRTENNPPNSDSTPATPTN
ncbi:MAG: hypothetical protein ACR2G5_08770 [Pyrinomonadaceae bacterium]